METKQRLLLIFSCVLIVAIPTVPFSARASASSSYGVQVTDTLRLGGVGDPQNCDDSDVDMTLQWAQIMQDATSATPYSFQNTWNYTSNNNYAQSKLQSFVTRFRNSTASVSGTGWAVSQASEFDAYDTSFPDFDSFHKMIRIWAFDPDTIFTLQEGGLIADRSVYYTDFFLNPNGYCRWQAWNYQEVATTCLCFQHNKFLFVNADSVNYPSDYSGYPIPTEPPTPPTTLYNGSVDCGNDSLEYMLLAQDGTTHTIPLTYESDYRAAWSYYLTSSPYTITVGCGSELATSYGSVTPMPPTSNDWICDTINDPHYCVLS